MGLALAKKLFALDRTEQALPRASSAHFEMYFHEVTSIPD
jgi:hypothetical protein